MHEYSMDMPEDGVESNGSPEQARDLAEPSEPLLWWNLGTICSITSVKLKDFIK